MRHIFKFEGITCGDCGRKIEEAINEIDGVKKAKLNFFTEKIKVEYEGDIEKIAKQVDEEIRKVERKGRLID